ncbi:MAG: acyl-CoA dehydrogenase, partial [Thermoleophilia bacterium]
MQLRDSPDEATFRAELRSWLELNAPKEPIGRGDVEAARAWSRALYEAGYVGLTWPVEYGGRGAPVTYQAIALEELARAQAPSHVGVIGLGMAGPTILVHGREEQKRRYLPKILSAEEIWCQGFSEPGAGSDLAAVRTRAELKDGRFLVNGQKVWSSYAHIADWCLLLARSDPESERHAGLTYLLVDMRAPGVEVRPLRQLTGEAEFNEIFFADVEVPVENVLGEIGAGWQVAVTTLMHERATLGFALTGSLEASVARLVALARERGLTDPRLRDGVAQEWIELQALKLTNARALAVLVQTGVPGPEGSVSKLHWSEQNQRLTKLALEIIGPDSLLADEHAWWRR